MIFMSTYTPLYVPSHNHHLNHIHLFIILYQESHMLFTQGTGKYHPK